MIDKKKMYEILDERGIPYEAYEHIPVYTVEEADALEIPYAEYGLKNLFLKDKKKNYYLVSLHGNKPIDLKKLRTSLGCTPLHFAGEDQLYENTGLLKGHVTPFGVLNSEHGKVLSVFDSALTGKTVGIHPMSNDATVFMSFDDLKRLIEDEGYEIKMIDVDNM